MEKVISRDGTPIAFDRLGHGLRGISKVAIYEAPFIVDNTHPPLSPTFVSELGEPPCLRW